MWPQLPGVGLQIWMRTLDFFCDTCRLSETAGGVPGVRQIRTELTTGPIGRSTRAFGRLPPESTLTSEGGASQDDCILTLQKKQIDVEMFQRSYSIRFQIPGATK